MTLRVFVSSTFMDLAPFRESVRTAVRQLGAVDISMENFGARDERPKEECLRLIAEESDIFIGVYAHRYGYVPAGESISITEAEYDAASSIGLPRMVYLIEESTPWIPANIDKGSSAQQLARFKGRLKSEHICEFFSEREELARKVVADLGRHLSRLQASKELKLRVSEYVDGDREYRLIQDLKSSDRYNVKRSIVALSRSPSPWLVDYLGALVLRQEEELAEISLLALKEISGAASARCIAAGMTSEFSTVRAMAAFTLGEMALFGRRADAEAMVQSLVETLKSTTEDIRILDEVVHSLGKIGGRVAFLSLTQILESNGAPPQLKAKALHGPGRFWATAEYAQFVSAAIPIIEHWSYEICESVSQSMIFEHIMNPLKELIRRRLSTGL